MQECSSPWCRQFKFIILVIFAWCHKNSTGTTFKKCNLRCSSLSHLFVAIASANCSILRYGYITPAEVYLLWGAHGFRILDNLRYLSPRFTCEPLLDFLFSLPFAHLSLAWFYKNFFLISHIIFPFYSP